MRRLLLGLAVIVLALLGAGTPAGVTAVAADGYAIEISADELQDALVLGFIEHVVGSRHVNHENGRRHAYRRVAQELEDDLGD